MRSEAHPAATVQIVPRHDQPGMLETLLCQSFAEDPLTECIDNFFACLDERTVSIKRPDKARARVYLTTKPEARFRRRGCAKEIRESGAGSLCSCACLHQGVA